MKNFLPHSATVMAPIVALVGCLKTAPTLSAGCPANGSVLVRCPNELLRSTDPQKTWRSVFKSALVQFAAFVPPRERVSFKPSGPPRAVTRKPLLIGGHFAPTLTFAAPWLGVVFSRS